MNPQDILNRFTLGNSAEEWLHALGVFAIVLGIQLIIRLVLIKRLAALAKHTSTDIDDLAVDMLSRTRVLFMVAVAVLAAQTALPNPPTDDKGRALIIHIIAYGALFVQGIVWANGFISYWIGRVSARQGPEAPANNAIVNAMGIVLRVVVILALFLFCLNGVVRITPVIAGLGIGGIAVALALQNVLGDLFAAVSILVDKPFTVGDFVVVDTFKGTIEDIGLKSTRVRSLGGEQIIFSNADMLRSRIRNFKRMNERRVMFATGVTYQTDEANLRRIPEMIKAIIESQKPVRFERCHFLKYADSWIEYETVFWVLSPDYLVYADIHQNINIEIFKKFQAEGINFAYHTRTLLTDPNTSGGAQAGASGGELAS